ncbi:3-hydroxyacyl-CoA dehydrogenase family protein [Frankia sp. R82]|uniref:3-hydroxyacyl-CoA dehydrogenase family protein n=1 Tax=Frankia sp. R82 TaxID=2950553 RepID=UPI002043A27F|nr:3-hydroxyacyl-CoA dehydrogenase NAD-binding domain-containing protein [Frankia sp. R82]MCM3882367.1 3-hydroxyacyl-CoA dehydrogenase NAD-binding domain-containing protein [Frankia sp. R82]
MSTTDHVREVPDGPAAVAVLGAGTIGLGWAALLLGAGHEVRLLVRRPEAEPTLRARIELHTHALPEGTGPARALLARLIVTTDVSTAVTGADVVIESISERLEAKQDLFATVADLASPDALLLSSTSTLLPDALAARATATTSGRIIVAHPFNPPHVIPLVEVLGAETTPPELIARTQAFLRGVGRTPVVVRRPIPGFIVNRLQTALLRECIHLVQQGVASVADIDLAVTHSIGLRWAVVGPFHALHLAGGPGGLGAWFEHIGAGLAAGWSLLGSPQLDEQTITDLVGQAEQGYDTSSYDRQVADRDARQTAVLAALADVAAKTLPASPPAGTA